MRWWSNAGRERVWGAVAAGSTCVARLYLSTDQFLDGGDTLLSSSDITVSALAITEMACMKPEGVMEQETTFVEFLADARTFRLTEEQLQIVISDGHETLTFIPQD